MKFTEKIMGIVSQAVKVYNDLTEQRRDIQRKFAEDKLSQSVYRSLLDSVNEQIDENYKYARKNIEAVRRSYKTVVEANSLVTGDMLSEDAKLLELPVELTPEQFDNLVGKHRGNPLMCNLLRLYMKNHPNKYEAYLPTTEQKIADFSGFCEAATVAVKEPDTLQAAFFLDGKYIPVSATESC